MPLILKNRFDRAVAQLAHSRALRSSNEVIEQLQEQNRQLQIRLQRASEQRLFDCQQHEKEIACLLRDLAEARYKLARYETRDALAAAPRRPLVHILSK